VFIARTEEDQEVTKRQAMKIFFANVLDHRAYRASTLDRMERALHRSQRGERRAARERLCALSPERRRYLAMIRIPIA
jgi:hypothetical protein